MHSSIDSILWYRVYDSSIVHMYMSSFGSCCEVRGTYHHRHAPVCVTMGHIIDRVILSMVTWDTGVVMVGIKYN